MTSGDLPFTMAMSYGSVNDHRLYGGGGLAKFLLDGGETPSPPQEKKNPDP